MAGLTVTERSHWRDRIAARIAKAVEQIKARHPALFDRVARGAHARALASLGLADVYAELEAIKAEEATLARRKKQAQRAMVTPRTILQTRGSFPTVLFPGHADLRPVRGPVLGPFARRSEALAAEVAWLERHWLTPDPPGSMMLAGADGPPPSVLPARPIPFASAPVPVRVEEVCPRHR